MIVFVPSAASYASPPSVFHEIEEHAMRGEAQSTEKASGLSVASPRKASVSLALQYAKDTAHNWLRFGDPVRKESRGRHASVAVFAPGQTFAYVRWRGGEHGTADWQVYVCRVPMAGADSSSGTQIVPGIDPGAEVLLHAATPHYARRALSLCKRIEEAGAALETVPPLYWREVQAAMRCRKPVPPFVPEAWGLA